MILNLKPFNKFIKYKHFKMECIDTAINCMQVIYGICKRLKDAFFPIPMYEPHQKFLKFVYDNNCIINSYVCPWAMGYQ